MIRLHPNSNEAMCDECGHREFKLVRIEVPDKFQLRAVCAACNHDHPSFRMSSMFIVSGGRRDDAPDIDPPDG